MKVTTHQYFTSFTIMSYDIHIRWSR